MAKLNLVTISTAVRTVLGDAHAVAPKTGNSKVDATLTGLGRRLRAGQPITEYTPIAFLWTAVPPKTVTAR